jgi:hypothetical protein
VLALDLVSVVLGLARDRDSAKRLVRRQLAPVRIVSFLRAWLVLPVIVPLAGDHYGSLSRTRLRAFAFFSFARRVRALAAALDALIAISLLRPADNFLDRASPPIRPSCDIAFWEIVRSSIPQHSNTVP